MQDLFGSQPKQLEFRDIRNTRPTVAEEKARLALQLGQLINTVPASIRNGSINAVRRWKADRERALKVLKSARSSVSELASAITSMSTHK